MCSFYFSVDQVGVDPLVWLVERPPAKKFNESRSFGSSSIHPQLTRRTRYAPRMFVELPDRSTRTTKCRPREQPIFALKCATRSATVARENV
jgi:hypothetical protein